MNACTDQRCVPEFVERAVTIGDSLEIVLDILDENDLAWNLTGAVIHWNLSKMIGSTALIVKTSANPAEVEFIAAENGRVRVLVAPTDWGSITPGTYKQEAQITDYQGRKSTVGQGTVVARKQQITA
jgi:hypothetical protein